MHFSSHFVVDLLERAVATYLQALAGFLVAGTTTINISGLQAAALAAVPAGLSVLKSGVATFVGDSETAALLPGPLATLAADAADVVAGEH